MWPVVGLISSFREGLLGRLALASLLEACDFVLILEGSVDGVDPHRGEPSEFWRGKRPPPNVFVRTQHCATDAAKRTVLIKWAQDLVARRAGHPMTEPPPFWVVVLDGDEELLWARALPAYLHRASFEERGAMRLKLCEADGQVMNTNARCLPGHEIDHYVLSVYQIMLRSGVIVTYPHEPGEKAPLMGEPHILHRSYLRPPERNAPGQRLSELERLDMADLGVTELERPGDDELRERRSGGGVLLPPAMLERT